MIRGGTILICLLILATALYAGDANVSTNVDRTSVSFGSTIEYSIEIGGDVSRFPDIAVNDLPDFDVYSTGTSQSFTWVNGKSQRTKRYVFRMAPRREGQLTIPAMALDIDGKRYQTQAYTISVSAGQQQARSSPAQPQRPQQQPQRQQQQQPTDDNRDDLFVRTAVDKDTVYVNEQITLRFRFFHAVELLQTDYTPPDKTGFWVEDLGPQISDYQNLNGRMYRVDELRTGLFPTAPGDHTVGRAMLTCLVQERRRNRDPFSIFDNFGFGQARTLKLSSDPIRIFAKPLPEAGKPADFTGAVGQYRIAGAVDKTRAEVNEPITMTIKISGTGNIKTVSLPTMPDLPEFRSYNSGDTENIERVNYRLAGSKTYEQVFIPKRAGTYVLPAISFSYFDPEARSYKIVSTEPVQVEIAPSSDRFASQVQNLQSNRIDPTQAARDIRYLKSETGNLNTRRSKPLAMNFMVVGLYLIPILGYIGIVQYQRRREKLESDVGFRRLKQARKMAQTRLATASELLDRADADGFYTATSRSLIDYFADRYNLPAFGLTADKIKEFAAGRQDANLIDRMLMMLQQCDFGRFAPGGSDPANMRQLLEDARQVIVDLEKTR